MRLELVRQRAEDVGKRVRYLATYALALMEVALANSVRERVWEIKRGKNEIGEKNVSVGLKSMMNPTDDKTKLEFLEKKLEEYLPKFLEKKKLFRGVKHEDSLSELRYTEFMVYKDIVEGFQRQISEIKHRMRSKRLGEMNSK